MDLILYHNACPDGFCSAFIANKRYPEAELIALDHGADHAEVLKKCVDKDVLMIDFSLRTRQENDWLNEACKSLLILDHHKTAQAVLEGAPYAIFDMARSGAGLTWDYLFGINSTPRHTEIIQDVWGYAWKSRPWYVDYVEDRDLWNWKLPNSREVNAYLMTLPFEIGVWKHLDSITADKAADLGVGSLAQVDHVVRETVKNVREGNFGGIRVGLLNTTYLNCSDIGNEIAKNFTFSLTWFERKDNAIQFSLRSIGEFDVSAIAKQYGGGGHVHAAGFQLPYIEGRKLIDVILGRETRG